MNSIGDYIRQQREQAKISLRQLADQARRLESLPEPGRTRAPQAKRGDPSADRQGAAHLRGGTVRAGPGILEDRPGDSGVRAAVLTDPQLTERQKQVLIEIYESFRGESQKPPTAEVVAVVRDHPVPEDTVAEDVVVEETADTSDGA